MRRVTGRLFSVLGGGYYFPLFAVGAVFLWGRVFELVLRFYR